MAFPTLHLILTRLFIFLCFLSLLIPGLVLVSCTTRLLGNETDKVSLLEFRKMIKDDPFSVMTTWNETIHFCEWVGVSCSRRHHRVTAINLISMKLLGSVPSHIGNLSFLRVLNLKNNSFSGEIPPEIGKLHKLQILNLNNNSLNGFIPFNISSCKNLKTLALSYNHLVGNIPTELSTLTNLQIFDISQNNLTGKIPHSLGNLSLLYGFSVSYNNFIGEIPDYLCRLPKIKYFVVSANNLSGTVSSSLFNHSTMLALDLAMNSIDGTLPPNLFVNLPNLFYFGIQTNNFTGNIPATLSNATNMQFFHANSNWLTGKVPDLRKLQKIQRFVIANNHLGEGKVDDLNFLSSLMNTTSIEILELSRNNFGGCFPKLITNNSRNLVFLHLHINEVSGKIPKEISNLIGLETLYLAANKFSGEIPSEIGFLGNLQELGLFGNNLYGKIPSSFGNLTRLIKLTLGQNQLYGKIPPSLGKCQNLVLLDVHKNSLSGYIPKEVLRLSSLSIGLDLSYNHLVGSISKEVGYLINLDYLDLSYNSLTGRIPTKLGSCVYLEMLSLTNNNFQGPIPSTLANLRGLQFLDLSHNKLTGQVPTFLKEFILLQNLNLSYNDFEGVVPTTGIFNNTSSFSIVGNRKLCGGIIELNLPKCNATMPKKKKPKAYLKIVIPSVLGIIVVITLAVFILCLRWLRRKRKEPFPDLLESSALRVSYQSLLKATNGLSEENLLGVGGFGAVYKGSFDHDGTFFAVKVLDLSRHGASRSFVAECEVLKNTRHRNLVKVLTACSGCDLRGNDFKALVYEYMDNGSLENWLQFSPKPNSQLRTGCSLSFVQKLNIVIDVACALDYLHNDCEPAIIHCDLKPSNVLLDQNMTAHVSDFGLARFVHAKIQNTSENNISTGVRGTIGYAPPEYGIGTKPSKSGDVYSFGILVLEILIGRKPTDDLFKDGLNLHAYAKAALPDRAMEIADPKILQERDKHINMKNKGKSEGENYKLQVCFVSVIRIGVACSAESPADRMNISDVVGELNKSRKSFLV